MARKKQESSETEKGVISRRALMKSMLVGLGAGVLIQPNGGVQGAEAEFQDKKDDTKKDTKKKKGKKKSEEPKKDGAKGKKSSQPSTPTPK